MKRLWVGVAVLLALTAAGIWAMEYTDRTHGEVSSTLQQAGQAALEEDWQRAAALQTSAKQRWEKGWGISAALSDHTELDAVDAAFARLEVYEKDRHARDFAAECAALAQQLEALGDGHQLSFRNLF